MTIITLLFAINNTSSPLTLHTTPIIHVCVVLWLKLWNLWPLLFKLYSPYFLANLRTHFHIFFRCCSYFNWIIFKNWRCNYKYVVLFEKRATVIDKLIISLTNDFFTTNCVIRLNFNVNDVKFSGFCHFIQIHKFITQV